MITMAWGWLLIFPAIAFAGAFFSGYIADKRARRRERQHEIRIRLVGLDGLEWMNVSCRDLYLIRRFGGQDDPPWQTLESIPRNTPVLLQVSPAHPDET